MAKVRGENRVAEVEKEIISLMDRYSWWRYLGMGRPARLPARLVEISFLTQNYLLQDIRLRLNNLIFYHYSLAFLIKLMAGEDISLNLAYCFLRAASVFFFFASLLVLFAVLKKILPLFWDRSNENDPSPRHVLLAASVLLVAFLPQLLIIALSVSPDSLCLFLGSLFMAASLNLALGFKPGLNLAIVAVVTLLGLFTDRSLFPLLFFAPFSYGLVIKKRNLEPALVGGLAFIFLAAVAIYALTQLFPLVMDNSFALLRNAAAGGLAGLKPLFSLSQFNRQFFLQLADSFLLRFGWMTFGASGLVYWVWRILVLVSFVGFLGFLIRLVARFVSGKMESVGLKIILFSWLAVIVQVMAVYAYYGRANILPQGRYLFPVIIPLILLFVCGLQSFFSLFSKRSGLAVLSLILIGEFILLNSLLWGKIIPVFHFMMRGPYQGI